jgi:hypothetical protein
MDAFTDRLRVMLVRQWVDLSLSPPALAQHCLCPPA